MKTTPCGGFDGAVVEGLVGGVGGRSGVGGGEPDEEPTRDGEVVRGHQRPAGGAGRRTECPTDETGRKGGGFD